MGYLHDYVKEPKWAQDHPRPNSQHNEIYFLQKKKGQGIRDKDRRQRSRKKEKGTRERGKDICPRWTKDCLWTEETDVSHRQITVYKGKGGKPHV